jgi:hypothetical protein
MKMKNTLIAMTSFGTICGNSLLFLWVLYNGISSGFTGTVYEVISYIALMSLLVLNTLLIIGYLNNKS